MYAISEVDLHTCPQIVPGETPRQAAQQYMVQQYHVGISDVIITGEGRDLLGHLRNTTITLPMRVTGEA